MKISLSTIKNANIAGVGVSIGRLWMRVYRYVFLFAFCSVLLWGMWTGYRSLVTFEWSQKNKDAYIAQESKKFQFQEEHFNTVITGIERRQTLYSQVPQGMQDPFYETTGVEQKPRQEEPQQAPVSEEDPQQDL